MKDEKRLIDIDDIIEDLGYSDFDILLKLLLEYRWQINRVDAVEVVHGRWRGETEEEQPHIVLRRVVCSVCNGKTDGRYNYCPHCAAKMDLEEEEQ